MRCRWESMCVYDCMWGHPGFGAGKKTNPSFLGASLCIISFGPGEGLRARNLSRESLRLHGHPLLPLPLGLLSIPLPRPRGISPAAGFGSSLGLGCISSSPLLSDMDLEVISFLVLFLYTFGFGDSVCFDLHEFWSSFTIRMRQK